MIGLPTRVPKKIRVTVRNVSETELKGLRLSVKSDACRGEVRPARVTRLIPGDRTSFDATLTRAESAASQRYPLKLTLRAKGLPLPAGIDLVVDLRRGPDRKWIDVGQVKLVRRTSGRGGLYLLAALPLLLVIGWLLWRVSHRRPKGAETDEPPDEAA